YPLPALLGGDRRLARASVLRAYPQPSGVRGPRDEAVGRRDADDLGPCLDARGSLRRRRRGGRRDGPWRLDRWRRRDGRRRLRLRDAPTLERRRGGVPPER